MYSKYFVVVLVALLACSALADQSNFRKLIATRAAQTAAPGDGSIVEGLIDGLSYVAGMPAPCSKSHTTVSNKFVEGTNNMAAAFKKIPNVGAFEEALRCYGQSLTALGDTLAFCGLNTVVGNWTAVANQISSNPGTGVTNLMSSVAARINSLHLNQLIPAINRDLQNGHEYAAGVKIGTIIATILTPNVPELTFFRILELLALLGRR